MSTEPDASKQQAKAAPASPSRILPHQLLKPGSLKGAAEERGDYFVWVENDVPYERLLMPGYWANIAASVRPGARIEVMRLDKTLDVTLRVVSVAPGLVTVRPMFPPYINDANIAKAAAADVADETETPEGYKIGFNPKGNPSGYFVQQLATGEPVAKGLASRGLAVATARAHAAQSVALPEAATQ